MWHTCRANDRTIDKLLSKSRKKERTWTDLMPDDPMQKLRVAGVPAKLWPNDELYMGIENGETLIPWSGHEDNKIDRFDGRALVDVIFPYLGNAPPLTEEEEEIENLCNFERYRDLVLFMAKSMNKSQILQAVEEKDDEIDQTRRAKHRRPGPTKEKAKEKVSKNKNAQVAFDYSNLSEKKSGKGELDPEAILKESEKLLFGDENENSEDEEDDKKETWADMVSSESDVSDGVLEQACAFAEDFGIDGFDEFYEKDFESRSRAKESQKRALIKAEENSKLSRRERRRRKDQRRKVYRESSHHSGSAGYLSVRGSPSYDDYHGRSRSRSRSGSRSRSRSKSRSVSPVFVRSKATRGGSPFRPSSPLNKPPTKKTSTVDNSKLNKTNEKKPLTPMERLKIKRQKLLTSQIKKDKQQQLEKQKEKEREEWIRELELQRSLRPRTPPTKYRGRSRSRSKSRSRSRSRSVLSSSLSTTSSNSSSSRRRRRRSKSPVVKKVISKKRSRSRSPQLKKSKLNQRTRSSSSSSSSSSRSRPRPRSKSPKNKSGNKLNTRSRSPPSRTARSRSRSRSPRNRTARSRSRSPPSRTARSRSRSRSPPSRTARSRSRSPRNRTARSRSRSPRNRTARNRSRSPPSRTARNRSRSRSYSPLRKRSKYSTRSRSRSRSSERKNRRSYKDKEEKTNKYRRESRSNSR